ncbi:hypothetical protein [Embleya sp. NPDC059237]|uniref:hypothetical protein n=1 Tax=Embleya sp. NPDC059237 TaxID=3346784 RepID=UPI00368350AE
MHRIVWTEDQRRAEIDGLTASLRSSERQLLAANRQAANPRVATEYREQAYTAAGRYGEEIAKYKRLIDGLRAGADPADLGYRN